MSDTRDSGEFASPPPRRWLDDKGGATDAERSLLRSGVNLDPPADADRKVWMALVAKVGPIGGGAGGGGGAPGPSAATAAKAAASAAAASSGIVTSALIGAACAVAVLVGSSALESRRPEPLPKPVAQTIAPARPIEMAPSPAPQAIAAPTPPTALSADAPDLHVASSSAPSSPKPSDTAPARSPDAPAALDPGAPRGGEFAAPTDPGGSAATAMDPGSALGSGDAASRLREESQLLSQARDALHGGDVARCFALLETARTRFPSGGLGQEREALTIEALAKSGNRALAVERANAFLAAHPTSPHAARVRTFAQ